MAAVSTLVGTACVRVTGKKRRPPKYRTTYSVRVTGARALAIFEILMPFLLGEKRTQAKAMLVKYSWMFDSDNIARLPKPLAEFYMSLNEKRLNVNGMNPALVPR